MKNDEVYAYDLPKELIAAAPAEPRDAARLFVYDTASGNVSFDTFANISRYLPKESLLVLNDTKVVPARLTLRKPTGGKVEVLFLINEWDGKGPVNVLADRKIIPGDILRTEALGREFVFEVIDQMEHMFSFKLLFDPTQLLAFLQMLGTTPVPKYIKGIGLSESELRSRYQTVFADHPASIAAPTASLHFTKEVLERIMSTGITMTKITLDVGLGTFSPVSKQNEREGKLHREHFSISEESVTKIHIAKREDTPVIAVGTTSVRALESAAEKLLSETRERISGDTDIFIRPPFGFKIVDHLITNFHLPGSSLMMLVEAFLQYKGSRRCLTDLYAEAIHNQFRFYSFGDSMLII